MTDTWPDLAEFPSFRSAGCDIRYAVLGAGEPVLLAHGALGDLRSLLPVAASLADAFATVTMSLPAVPAAVRPLRPFGTDGQAADLLDLIAHLGRGPVHLAAWSYAAHAALVLAARHPGKVKSLFLFEPGFPTYIDDEFTAQAVIDDMMRAFAPVAEALAAGNVNKAVGHAIDAAAMEQGYFDRQPEACRLIHQANAASLQALFEQSQPTALTASELAAIACPTTIARGARTRACYSLVTDAAARLVPGARHVIVADAGHLLPEQEPQRFAAQVREHLGSAARSSSGTGAAK